MTIDIVSRDAWGARPARRRPTITTPTPELWLHHTAGDHSGPRGMRAIQDFHMDDRGWTDIAYSFVVDPASLAIYEGRGPGIAGGHTRGHNTISHAICVMGDFNNLRPTPELIKRIAELVAHGHDQGWWPDQLSGGHRDVASTACPGSWLYDAIPAINALASNGGTPMPTATDRNELVAEHQMDLTEAGYDPGPIDGIYGPRTRAADKEALADLNEANVDPGTLAKVQAADTLAAAYRNLLEATS